MPTSRFAVITFLDGQGGSPDNSLPGFPQYPSNALPGAPVYPSNGLPGLPPFAVTLPVFPFDPTKPDNTLPGGGQGGNSPDNSLPRPGKKYIVKWLACSGLILVPDNELPETAEPK